MTTPACTFESDHHTYLFEEEQVQITLERLHEEKREGLQAEIHVFSLAPYGQIYAGKVSVISPISRKTNANALQAKPAFSSLPWPKMIDQVCLKSLDFWRFGQQAVRLTEVEDRPGARWLLKPFIEVGSPTVLFADGGTGKSFFGLGLALTVATGHPFLGYKPSLTGPVLYMDWEADAYTAKERARAICRSQNLSLPENFHYLRMVASLREVAPAIKRQIGGMGIQLVIVDSLGMAKAGDIESNDASKTAFEAARILDTSVVFLDHISKQATLNEKAAGKPFGGVYSHNLARVSWAMERAEVEDDDEMFIVSLLHRKANNGPQFPRLSYYVALKVDPLDPSEALQTVTFTKQDAHKVPELFGKLNLREQVIAVIRNANLRLTFEQITHEFMVRNITPDEAAVKRVLERLCASQALVANQMGGEVYYGQAASQALSESRAAKILNYKDDDYDDGEGDRW